MDYEQKYKEALERARKIHKYSSDLAEIKRMEGIFPELAESEGERIRKEIIAILQYKYEKFSKDPKYCNAPQWIAWLEKQDKSSDQIHYWTEEEIEPIISDYLRGAEHYGGMIARLRCLKPKSLEKQGQKPAWDERDESHLIHCVRLINNAEGCSISEQENAIVWLKSLKQKHTWKPSEEQMRALHDINLTGKLSYVGQGQTLIELYNDLKKL